MKSSVKSCSVKIKNDLSELNKVISIFDTFKSEHTMPFKATNSVDIALDEILNNIISYGYDDYLEHEIEVQISISGEYLILKIIDDGLRFNPLEKTNTDTKSNIENRAIGGLGIHLIKNMMDKMNYEYKNNKNCLTMFKNIKETK